MAIDRRKYLWRIKRLEIKSWLKYLMIEGKSVIDYVLGELTSGTDITIDNTVEKKFYKFDVKGNSIQDGTPTPTNEVPILSSGDDGTISEKIVNKNLFDGQNPVYVNGKILNDSGTEINDASGGYTKMYIPVKPNTTYTVSGLSASGSKRIYYFDKNKTFISRTTTYSGTSATFTTSANCYFVDIQYFLTGNDFTTYQIEQSSTAATYTAHQEQTYTIPVQQPMRSIGDVRDEFIKVNGEWKERHNIKRLIITGNERWSINSSWFALYNINKSLNYKLKATRFSGNSQWGTSANNGFIATTTLYITQSTFGVSTVNELTAILQEWNNNGSPLIVDYILETPQDLPCTEEQIAILENLPKSYNEQTNVYSLDVTPAYVEAKAYVKKEEE